MIYQLKCFFELLNLGGLEEGEDARWFAAGPRFLGFRKPGREIGRWGEVGRVFGHCDMVVERKKEDLESKITS